MAEPGRPMKKKRSAAMKENHDGSINVVYDCPPHTTVNSVSFDKPFDGLEIVPGSMKRTATGWEWKMRQKEKVTQ